MFGFNIRPEVVLSCKQKGEEAVNEEVLTRVSGVIFNIFSYVRCSFFVFFFIWTNKPR